MRSVFVLFAAVVFMAGCTKTNEQELLLEAQYSQLCEKDTISFSQDIHPLIQVNCMPCHSSAQAEGFIVMESYAEIKGVVDAGYLPGVIRHDPGFLAMPKDRPKLRDCEIRAFEVWISQGASNN